MPDNDANHSRLATLQPPIDWDDAVDRFKRSLGSAPHAKFNAEGGLCEPWAGGTVAHDVHQSDLRDTHEFVPVVPSERRVRLQLAAQREPELATQLNEWRGRPIGNYKVIGVAAIGGQAIVLAATGGDTDGLVAMKFPRLPYTKPATFGSAEVQAARNRVERGWSQATALHSAGLNTLPKPIARVVGPNPLHVRQLTYDAGNRERLERESLTVLRGPGGVPDLLVRRARDLCLGQREHDPGAKLAAAGARLELALEEHRDPALLAALRRQIAALRAAPVSEDEAAAQLLESDESDPRHRIGPDQANWRHAVEPSEADRRFLEADDGTMDDLG